jgi:GPH family glycoside/pentoside/hexuronide:cation symporter
MLAFGAGEPPMNALGTAMAISVQPYFASGLGVDLITIAAAFGLVRLIDMPVDPVLAVFMDATRTPIGRYRAWMLAGTPFLLVSVWMLFMAHKGIGIGYLIIWLLVYALGTSIVGLARSAWSANLVTRYDQRSQFYGYLGFIGVAGALIVLETPTIAGWIPHQVQLPNNVQLMGWVVLGMTPIGLGITALLVPEAISPNVAKNRYALRDYWEICKKPEVLRLFISNFALALGPGWMGNLYVFFFTAARGFSEAAALTLLSVYILAGVVAAPLIGWVGGRFGKHQTMIVSTLCYSLGLCTVPFIPLGSFVWATPMMIWTGFMANGFGLMNSAMMADVGDEVRLEQGKERMGLLFAFTSLSSKLASAGAVMISYPLLKTVGYVPTLAGHNTPAAILGLTLIFIVGPIFWVILGGVCFIGWRLDARRHAEIRRELEARDAAILAGSAREGVA